ncbi:major head protein [Haloarcula californiae tailed virus 2]|uniref:Major capsid protein n=1 Tax=Haloarcula californiae tailed virus 2 TaxID=1273747 RepID=R4T7Q6_9CAUD|nr:major head protein [Haloarcula californiae tailed virus 2]AGM11804.1 major capsid protein [Haloarcula californiae tailed virus 2]
MASIVKNHGSEVRSAKGGINSREAQVAHRRSFGQFVEKATEAAGMPGDQVPYWDPMGFLNSRGEAIEAKSTMFEKWEGAFQEFNRLARDGYPLQEAAKEVTKSIDRTSYSLPIFFTPDVFITDQEDLPLADMLARTAVQEDTIQVDELTAVGDASSFDEGTNWPENDDTYNNLSYDVEAYGRRNEVTDFVQLAANTLRSTRALTEDQQVTAIRRYEEDQIIVGQGNVDADVSANDSTSWLSLTDHAAASGTTVDAAGSTIDRTTVRDAIRDLRRKGASRDDIVHVTDHKTFQDLQEDVQDFTMYESPADDFSFGFQALSIDGTMVLESHGSTNTDGERLFTSFDASAHYMAMLQDVTMHPLARDTPTENFATDAYGVLVSESPSRTHAVHNLA